MTVYVVFREAVYRHECLGVFSTLDAAKAAADAAVLVERDGHHKINVYPYELDSAVVGAIREEEPQYAENPDFTEPTEVYSAKSKRIAWYRVVHIGPEKGPALCGEEYGRRGDGAVADCESCLKALKDRG